MNIQRMYQWENEAPYWKDLYRGITLDLQSKCNRQRMTHEFFAPVYDIEPVVYKNRIMMVEDDSWIGGEASSRIS